MAMELSPKIIPQRLYETALIAKWHLGLSDSNERGNYLLNMVEMTTRAICLVSNSYLILRIYSP